MAEGGIARDGNAKGVFHKVVIFPLKQARERADGSRGKSYHPRLLEMPEGEFMGTLYADTGRKDAFGNEIFFTGAIKIADQEHKVAVTQAQDPDKLYVSIYQVAKQESDGQPAPEPESLLELLPSGPGTMEGTGVLVTRYSQKGSVDWDRVVQDFGISVETQDK